MDAKPELLMRLQQIISDHLGIQQEDITEKSTWGQLGADSLDRMEMSLAIEEAFRVDIPHPVGERLNTVEETVEHLLTLLGVHKEISTIQIEAATTNVQWAEMSRIRTQVFSLEYRFSFRPLPGPGETGIWHFLAREGRDAVGALSIVDTTRDGEVHRRYGLSFGENDRIARYAQLAILKSYRKRGVFRMLIDTAQSAVVRPNGFTVGWLLYPAERARSSVLTQDLGFIAQAPLLTTEFGSCHALIRRESTLVQAPWIEKSFPTVETYPM